ncbi:hypothetical protein ARAM_007640 [Aspergillus rambellii]|uniref:Uncharacterized protein n=1 Tax=Aspergillus rambellii TaxID=308745 RepID=A0A0F8V4N9_9EURO|nr:hypothetical protein ARAM_007640 [Aspergillus rambellii]
MPVPTEHPERKEMRKWLRSVERHITGLKPDHRIAPSEIDQIQFMPMVLDENSKDGPVFFAPLDESLLPTPDNKYDEEYDMKYDTHDSIQEDWRDPKTCAQAINIYWSTYISHYSLAKKPPGGEVVWSPVGIRSRGYKDLYRYVFPEFGFTDVEQGELLPILRLMIAHLRRARFIDHMVAPVSLPCIFLPLLSIQVDLKFNRLPCSVMAFSFMGPQHARVIEAYVEGHTVVVRPTKLYDLRTKDAAAFQSFAQWYFGKPCAPTGQSQ